MFSSWWNEMSELLGTSRDYNSAVVCSFTASAFYASYLWSGQLCLTTSAHSIKMLSLSLCFWMGKKDNTQKNNNHEFAKKIGLYHAFKLLHYEKMSIFSPSTIVG